MVNKKLTIEQARDILNKSYRVSENDCVLFPPYTHGSWVIKYNHNNNNYESDIHPLEEKFLYYSGSIPQLYIKDGKHCIGWSTRCFNNDLHIDWATRLLWESDIQKMTKKEFIKLCNKDFAAIIDGTEENKLYKELREQDIKEEEKSKQEMQKRKEQARQESELAQARENTKENIKLIIFLIIIGMIIIMR